MNIIFFSFILTIFTTPLLSYQSAHAIIISHYNNDSYVLLGKMKNSQLLSTFGGRRDPGEKDPKVTCSREIEEEALGVFGSKKELASLMEKAIQVSGFSNGHICYLLPAKFYGKNIPHKFRFIRFNNKSLSDCQKEMIDIVAIRVSDLKKKIQLGVPLTFPDNQGVKRAMRSSTEGALKAAVINGKL